MTLLQTIVDGVILGGFYALIAQGVALTFGVMRVVNLAHGELMLVGAYLAWAFHEYLGLGILVALPAALVVGYVVGWLVARLAVLHVIERHELMSLLLTFGLAFLIQGALITAFTTTPRSTPAFYSDVVWRPLGITVPVSRLVMLAGSLVILACLAVFLYRTRSGRAMKAAAQNKEAARIVGIDVNSMYARAFAIGAALAFGAGVLFSATQAFTPNNGVVFTLKAFVIVVVGGVGRISGTVAAAVLVGLIETALAAYVPDIGTGLGVAAAFVLVVVVLAVRRSSTLTPAGGHS
ncbi:branched-chain amino acid ABC transporter permease [Kribbella lupini]|uniref:Branched-chain amino acid ABC transporter permease n=1 Tax=Kribbella lupini TaxID=291602 RepID=A0ABP4NF53_9ACTN